MTALEDAFTRVERAFGQGAVIRMNSKDKPVAEVISTGSIGLDLALGGGLPRGRAVELYGVAAGGKSTIAMHTVANAQKLGSCLYVDAENSFDPTYAERIGIDVDSLLLAQPSCGEEGFEIAEMFLESGELSVVVFDSVAAMVPRAELENDFGSSNVGLHARLLSQAMRKLTGQLNKNKTLAIFINQLRAVIAPFGPSETTTGGKALGFYSSVRLDVRRADLVKRGDEVIGQLTKVKIVKNKIAPPHRQAIVEILYGDGISREGEIIDMGVERGIITKKGSWFSYGDRSLGQGREGARSVLKSDGGLSSEIEALIRG